MKESKFVEQNKKNWLEFETDLRTENIKTRHSKLFIQVTDDLSYARTFFKYRSVRVYLNGIAQLLFNNLYQNQSTGKSGFVKFWKYDLPYQIHCARKEFRISFIIFILAMGIGVLSSIYDKEFARLILGNDYVQMTIENIKSNDAMAVYKKANEAQMFLGITINNLIVAMYTFVLGVFMSIGTVLALLRNGIMVGVFQYFFVERGLFKESFLTIWQHGTIEISCIIIAGAAGLTLGRGLVFPGTYSRINSLKISALRGLKIFLGITPLIVLAGFIESFITRYTNVPDFVRIMVILLSLSFILFYFVWYPWYLKKHKMFVVNDSEKISYKEPVSYDFSKILTAPEIIGNSFKYFSNNILSFLIMVMGFALLHALTTLTFSTYQTSNELDVNSHSFITFFNLDCIRAHFWIGVVTLTLLQINLSGSIRRILESNDGKKRSGYLYLISSSLISSFLVLLPFYFDVFWGVASFIMLSPILFTAVYKSYNEKVIFPLAIGETFGLLSNSWGKQYGNSFKIFVFIIVVYILLNTEVAWNYIQMFLMNFKYDEQTTYLLEIFILSFITIAIISVYAYFLISTSIFNYYAFREISMAESLNQRIEMFGERKVLFGFEKEQNR